MTDLGDEQQQVPTSDNETSLGEHLVVKNAGHGDGNQILDVVGKEVGESGEFDNNSNNSVDYIGNQNLRKLSDSQEINVTSGPNYVNINREVLADKESCEDANFESSSFFDISASNLSSSESQMTNLLVVTQNCASNLVNETVDSENKSNEDVVLPSSEPIQSEVKVSASYVSNELVDPTSVSCSPPNSAFCSNNVSSPVSFSTPNLDSLSPKVDIEKIEPKVSNQPLVKAELSEHFLLASAAESSQEYVTTDHEASDTKTVGSEQNDMTKDECATGKDNTISHGAFISSDIVTSTELAPSADYSNADVVTCSTDFESGSNLEDVNQSKDSTTKFRANEDSNKDQDTYPMNSSFCDSTTTGSSNGLTVTGSDFTCVDGSKSVPFSSATNSCIVRLNNEEEGMSSTSEGVEWALVAGDGDLDQYDANSASVEKNNEVFEMIASENEDKNSQLPTSGVSALTRDALAKYGSPFNKDDRCLNRSESVVTLGNLSTCVNYSVSDLGDLDLNLTDDTNYDDSLGPNEDASCIAGHPQGDVKSSLTGTNFDGNQTNVANDSSVEQRHSLVESAEPDSEVSGNDIKQLMTVKSPSKKDEASIQLEQSTENEEKENVPLEDSLWDDILGNGGLRKKILRAGYGESTRPQKGEVVTVKYTVYKKDDIQGEDDTCSRIPLVGETCLDFILGDSDVIDVLDLGVQLMQMNEHCVIQCDSRFGYGEFGYTPSSTKSAICHDSKGWPEVVVDPNTDLELSVELLNSKDLPSDFLLYTPEQMENALRRKKEKGNFYSRRGEWDKAIAGYNQALKMVLDDENQDKLPVEQMNEWKVTLYNNMAFTQLNTELYRQAIASCDFAIEIAPDNVKAHFRKAKALSGLGETMEAIEELTKARSLNPRDKEINLLMTELQERHKTNKKKEKEVYQKMMKKMNSSSCSLSSDFNQSQSSNKNSCESELSTPSSSFWTGSRSSTVLSLAVACAIVGLAVVGGAYINKFRD